MNLDKTYKDFIKDLKQRIYSAKTKAILSANRLMIELYFDIGHEIVNKQDKLGWGKSIVEQMSKDLKNEISDMLASTDKDGFYLKRRFYFMGKWIKHGGYYPTKLLRLFKKDKGRVERDINEQFIVDGNVGELQYDFVDENHKGIFDWIEKHNKYATFEARELMKNINNPEVTDELANLFGTQVERKRWIREKIWNRLLPPLIRPFIYYLYRYFLRLGFLDGKVGFIYHTLHGLFYRLLIDVKFIEMKYKEKNKK